jgi:hypothetical protein
LPKAVAEEKEGTAAVMAVVRAMAMVAARTEVAAPVTGIAVVVRETGTAEAMETVAVVERAGKAAEVVKAARGAGITVVGTEAETAAVTGGVDMLEEVAA